MDIAKLPFNHLLGLTVDGNVVSLSPRHDHLNHVNTIHATVLYGIAESASGLCLLNRFPELTDHCVAVLRTASVKYRQPAVEGSDITAAGILSYESAEKFLDSFHSRHRALVEIAVDVKQNEIELLSGSFCWFLSKA